MKRVAIVALALSATLLLADNSQYKYEFTPMIGGTVSEGNLDLANQLNYGGALGINLDKNKFFNQVEVGFLGSDRVYYDHSSLRTHFNKYFTNLIKNHRLNNKTSLYTLIGVGYEDITNEQFDNKSSGFFNYGIGLKYKIMKDMFLKGDIRHAIKFNHSENSIMFLAGISIPFGKAAQPEAPKKAYTPIFQPKDSDSDGVVDSFDKCPNTQQGIKVDQNGCPVDSDSDGVVDSFDKCPNTQQGIKVDQNGCPVEITLRLNFDFKKAVIKPQYNKKLQEYAEYLKKMQKKYLIKVKGYTDSIGSKDRNQKLSKMRADAVRTKLIELGVDANRIFAKGCGESNPIATNTTEDGRYQNRRVVIELQK